VSADGVVQHGQFLRQILTQSADSNYNDTDGQRNAWTGMFEIPSGRVNDLLVLITHFHVVAVLELPPPTSIIHCVGNTI
jgi:hypothetical protein